MKLTFSIPGDPVPCQRPRVGRGGTVYTPRETQVYEQHVSSMAYLAAYRERWTRCDPKTPISVQLEISRSKSKRGDIDNIAKSILDGITKSQAVWADDRDVMELSCSIATSNSPGVRVVIEVQEGAK